MTQGPLFYTMTQGPLFYMMVQGPQFFFFFRKKHNIIILLLPFDIKGTKRGIQNLPFVFMQV